MSYFVNKTLILLIKCKNFLNYFMKIYILFFVVFNLFLFINASSPKLKLEKSSCVKVKVGESNLTLAIDPSSNVNYIFDGTLKEYEGKSYNKEKTISLKTSNALLTASNIFGEFTGNLAIEEFTFPFIIDGKEENLMYPLTFVLVKESSKVIIPDKIDGILGLGYLENNANFYKKMNLIEQLFQNKKISKRQFHINFESNDLSFGDSDYEILNQTEINIQNINDNTSKSAYPILYYSDTKMGFSSGSTSSFDIENKLKVNLTFIPLWDNDNAIIAPESDKSTNIKLYLEKLSKEYAQDSNEFYTSKSDPGTKTAIIFENNYFVYDWLESETNNDGIKNKIKIELTPSLQENLWNINIKPVFHPQHISYNYEEQKIVIANCEFCGMSKHYINLTSVILIILGFVGAVLVICWCFGKYVSYRKDKASKFLKKYDLI